MVLVLFIEGLSNPFRRFFFFKMIIPTHVIKDLVVNLRKQPVSHQKGYKKDPLQETQLLKGDSVISLKEKEGWLFVQVLEQKRYYSESGWGNYLGWINKKHVRKIKCDEKKRTGVFSEPYSKQNKEEFTLGSFVTHSLDIEQKQSLEEKQEKLLSLATLFLGSPYFWGGASFYLPQRNEVTTSVDCSGLTYLIHKTLGIEIPRNAHDQYLLASPVEGTPRPGDLLFYREYSERPEFVSHVAIVKDKNTIIEATTQSSTVREVLLKGRFSSPLTLSCGRFLC
jgi:cell wall-associated NlpC family hydrolase